MTNPAKAKTLSDRALTRTASYARSGARRYPAELTRAIQQLGAPDLAHAALDSTAPDAPLAAAWLGHATVLLRTGGLWVLTDPVMSWRIGPRLGRITMGLQRLSPPFDPVTLPPIDVILLSHAHYDHFDLPTLRTLARPSTRVVTAHHTRSLVPRGFGDVSELRWDQTIDIGSLSISAVRPKHWGARTAWDRHRGYNSYLIQSGTPDKARVLYAGDTAMTDAFRGIAGERGLDLSVFGIGAYDPWIDHHASPEQVWEMHTSAGGNFLLPIHHSTFRLSDEPHGEPMQRLVAAAADKADRIVGTTPGVFWTHALRA